MADVPGQYFFVGETGSDACGIGYITTAVAAYINDKSVACGKVGEYLIQIPITDSRGETFVTHIADVVLEYLVLDACGSAVVGTGFTQIYIFYNILAKVARVVLIPCIIIRYVVGRSEVYMPVLQFVQHISQDFKQAFAAHSVGDEFAVFVMYGIPVYLFVFQKTILLIDNLP